MQPIDALTLSYLAGEWDAKLADGKIHKIQQASHFELLLQIWVGGEAGRQKFYINIHPQYAFCALIEDSSFLQFPANAFNFCMVLRKYLQSARIQKVATLPHERVLNLALDNYNELGQYVPYTLSIELMGKHSNMILVDNTANMILGCAHGVSEAMSQYREVSVGYPYAPPPKPLKPNLFALTCSEFIATYTQALSAQQDPAAAMTQQYQGLGKATLKDIFTYEPNPEKAYVVLHSLKAGTSLSPMVKRDGSSYSLLAAHADDPDWQAVHSLNTMITAIYLRQLLKDRLENGKQQLQQVLKTQEKKLQEREAEVQKTDPKSIALLKRYGDLLTIACSQQPQFTGTKIEVLDYETQQPITIALDPTLNLAENAQLYYRRYKKAQTRAQMATALMATLAQTRQFIQTIHTAIDLATSLADLQPIREDLENQGWLKPVALEKKSQKSTRSQPLKVTASNGMTLWIGRNNLQNQQIVSKLAQPEDLWLHAHLVPGSHVLIKTDKQPVSDETLLEAAMLAAYFSQARGSANVPVVYTLARYVRKIPDSYPGHVTYTHEQAIHVTPDPPLIQHLLEPQQAKKINYPV